MSSGKWMISRSEEQWELEEFHSKYEAIAAAPDYFELDLGETFYVGQKRTPVIQVPTAKDIIDLILDSEDFCVEWAEGEFSCSKEQSDELTEEIKKTFTEWMIRHGLEPTFFLIDNATKHVYSQADDQPPE